MGNRRKGGISIISDLRLEEFRNFLRTSLMITGQLKCFHHSCHAPFSGRRIRFGAIWRNALPLKAKIAWTYFTHVHNLRYIYIYIYIPSLRFIAGYVYKHSAFSFYDFRGEIHGEINLRFSTYRTGQLDVLFSILNSMK